MKALVRDHNLYLLIFIGTVLVDSCVCTVRAALNQHHVCVCVCTCVDSTVVVRELVQHIMGMTVRHSISNTYNIKYVRKSDTSFYIVKKINVHRS